VDPDKEDSWDVWMLSAKGEIMTTPLCAVESDCVCTGFNRHLLVTDCGPIIQVGQRSVAVGLGNVIKVITIGSERYVDESSDGISPMIAGRRRRIAVPRKRN
jgi:hypothetical protein